MRKLLAETRSHLDRQAENAANPRPATSAENPVLGTIETLLENKNTKTKEQQQQNQAQARWGKNISI